MLLSWFGVRALRAAPDRAAAWQRGLDALADELGVELIWCMATPADLVLAATLDHVVAVRTSDDYRFAADPALLWTWYLTVNRLAGSLGLRAFKDCFFSRRRPQETTRSTATNTPSSKRCWRACRPDRSASATGSGVRTARWSCEPATTDGRLRHVDRPLALVDSCLFGEPARGERLAWATTTSTRDGKVWTYVVAINTATERRVIADRLDLAALGLEGSSAVYDWRHGAVERDGRHPCRAGAS